MLAYPRLRKLYKLKAWVRVVSNGTTRFHYLLERPHLYQFKSDDIKAHCTSILPFTITRVYEIKKPVSNACTQLCCLLHTTPPLSCVSSQSSSRREHELSIRFPSTDILQSYLLLFLSRPDQQSANLQYNPFQYPK